jgi:hypothetical protein
MHFGNITCLGGVLDFGHDFGQIYMLAHWVKSSTLAHIIHKWTSYIYYFISVYMNRLSIEMVHCLSNSDIQQFRKTLHTSVT